MTSFDISAQVYSRDGLGKTARIRQGAELKFSQIMTGEPMLVLILRGVKQIAYAGCHYQASAGECIAIAGECVLDVTNRLPSQGVYEALWLSWDSSLIDEFEQYQKEQCKNTIQVHAIRNVNVALKSALERAAWGIAFPDAVPDAVMRHQLLEVLVWLDLYCGRFAAKSKPDIVQHVRRLLVAQPARPWCALDVAQTLAMSEATLRRRLAEKNTNFYALLTDVRMTVALSLLQCTEEPVAHIAMAVGYASSSRFADRFKKRFGFLPHKVRG